MTYYTTEPKIYYEVFINTPLEGHTIKDLNKDIYTTSSKLIESIVNDRKNYVHLRNVDGYCQFIRYNTNEVINLFSEVIKKYNVKVIDEYGFEFPDFL
jgi:hypothetical protein